MPTPSPSSAGDPRDAILAEEFQQLRELPHSIWRALVGTSKLKTIRTSDGRIHEVRVSPTWADASSSDVLVLVSVRSRRRPGRVERSFVSEVADGEQASAATESGLRSPSPPAVVAPWDAPPRPSPPARRDEPAEPALAPATMASEPDRSADEWPPPDLALHASPAEVPGVTNPAPTEWADPLADWPGDEEEPPRQSPIGRWKRPFTRSPR